MQVKITFIVAVLSSYFLSSCAGVKIYSDAGLTKETGLKFYHAKPFLLVERNGAKDVALKASIVYLPDMRSPSYAKAKSGLGTSDLKVAFENGSISSYGVVTDSKVPETITSLTGLLTGYGSTVKSLAEATQIKNKVSEGEQPQSASVADLQNAKKILDNVKKEIARLKTEDLSKNVITENQKGTFTTFATAVIQASTLIDAMKPDNAEKASDEIDKAISQIESITSMQENQPTASAYNGTIQQLKTELTEARKILKPVSVPTVVFELYEVIYPSTGGVQLKLVSVSK